MTLSVSFKLENITWIASRPRCPLRVCLFVRLDDLLLRLSVVLFVVVFTFIFIIAFNFRLLN